MSTTVDSRVLEMRFDNRQFETNVQTSMSTLDKLKQKLNLSGASKGLENINTATKNVNMSGLGSAIETVSAKFSALDVIGVTALANITNSAVNAGKRIVSALTIDPIKTGFSEYETQINAVQTILANTSAKGTTIDDVNKALDELNKYADLTIYNFTEMTRNIGTFTAAGIDLDTSVNAIQGIANLAAVSGSTSQQASTAMYQLSQALATGTVKLMDWNSVVNAGMGGEIFQNALKETSELLKTGAEEAIEAEGSFRDSLQVGWLTSEVLTETLKKFTTSGANEYVAEYTGLSQEAVQAALDEAEARYGEADAIKYASEALAEKSGKNKDEIADALQFAKTAEDAATKVKTFTQLWDVLKEAAQSGWAQTWKLIFGDFEEAKALFTPLADFLTGIINGMSEARNSLIEGAMSSPFGQLVEKINSANTSLGEAVDAVSDYATLVDEIINGDWGNGQTRIDKLTEAGYDWAHAQNLVNEKLGDGTRHATDYKEATEDATSAQKYSIEQLAEMSDAQLKNIGYTEDQISALRQLEEEANKVGIPLGEFVEKIDELDGRTLLINSFKNAGQGLVTIITAIRDAWREVFPPMTSEQLYNIIAALHKFSTNLVVSDETADNLKRTLKGLFAALDIILTVVGGPIKIAFKVLNQLLGMFDLNILDVTAGIGDAIVGFRDGIDSVLDFTKVFEKIMPPIQNAITAFRDWITSLKESENLPHDIAQGIMNGLGTAFEFVSSIVSSLISFVKSGFTTLPDDMASGLIGGIREKLGVVGEVFMELGKMILEKIKSVLGIQSPSTEMFEVGKNLILGLVEGVKIALGMVWELFTSLGEKIIEIVKDIDLSTIFAGVVSGGMLLTFSKIASALESLSSPFEGIGDVLGSASGVLDAFKGTLKSFSLSIKADAIKTLAIAIAILVGAIFVLTQLDVGKVWGAVAVIAVLAGILGGLSIALEKLSSSGSVLNTAKISGILISLSASLILMALAAKIIGGMNPDQAKQGLISVIGMIAAMVLVIAALGKLVSPLANTKQLGKLLIKLSVALLLMVVVIKLVSGLSAEELLKGGAAILAFVGIVALLGLITKLTGSGVDKLGGMMIKLSIAMILMVVVIKLVSGLSAEELLKGGAAILAFVGVIALLALITKLVGEGSINKLGSTLFKISAAMLIMAVVVKLIGGMSVGELAKGIVALYLFTGVIAILTAIVKSVGNDAPKIAGTLLAMSLAIGILAAVAIMLSLISIGGLAKGIIAVGLLGGLMTAMIWATRGANNVKGSIIAMAVAIGIMAAAVVVLSFIEPSKLAGATAAMAVLMGMFALIIKSAGTINGGMGVLLVMTVAITLMGGMIYLLAQLPIDSVLASSGSLALLMGTMAAVMLVLSKVRGISAGSLAAIVVMGLVVGELAYILYKMAEFNVAPSLETAASLSLLLIALSAATLILSKVGAGALSAIAGAAALAGVIAIIGGVAIGIGALMDLIPQDKIDAWKNGLQNFMDFIVILAGGLGEAIGAFVGGVLDGITSVLPGIGTSLSEFMTNVQPFIDGARSVDGSVLEGVGILTAAILALTVASLIEGIASLLPFVPTLGELGSELSNFMINALPFIMTANMIDPAAMEGVRALAETILILTAADMLSGISSLISFFTGGSSFDSIGECLSSFGAAVVAFSKQISGKLDAEAIEAASVAGQLLAALQNSMPKSGGWLQDILGETDWTKFNEGIKGFGSAITTFNESVSSTSFDSDSINTAVNAGKLLLELQTAIPKSGGWLQEIMGTNDWSTFNAGIRGFGSAIVEFNNSVATESIDADAMATATNAGSALATLQDSIPKTGGWLQEMLGVNEWDIFNAGIRGFGSAIVEFNNSVDGENTIDQAAVTAAIDAGTALTTLQTAIPKTGGWLDEILGVSEWTTFNNGIKGFGSAIKEFNASIGEGIDDAAVQSAVNAGTLMAELQDAIPTDKWLDGKVSIDDFGKKIVTFGEHLVDYSATVSEIDNANMSSSITSANRLLTLANNLVDLDVSGINNFNVEAIGTAIKSYYDKISETDVGAISSSVTSANTLINMITRLASLDTSGISNFKVIVIGRSLKSYYESISGVNLLTVSGSVSSVNTLVDMIRSMAGLSINGATIFKASIDLLSETNISGFVEAFSGASDKFASVGTDIINALVKGLKTDKQLLTSTVEDLIENMLTILKKQNDAFQEAGKMFMKQLIMGVTTQSLIALVTLMSVVSSIVKTIRTYYSSMYEAGKYLGTGLVAGINAKKTAAYNAGYALGQAAVRGEKAGQASNSPSKLTELAGNWIGEGLIIGMNDMASKVYQSGENLGETATSSLSSAISKVSDLISSGIETEPTIRPVLDLSDVRSGANNIAGMLTAGSSVGVLANVGAISSAMNQRNQNGVNNDVVSAINKLRKDLGNVGNTSYTVNGVTYDDGSNVSDAVKSLVRAARVERRR